MRRALLPLLAALALSCQPPPPEAPDPEAALRPGLQRLLPYDFAGRSPEGLRWLENHSALQPRADSARRARRWLLRARLDWLTLAYLEPDRDARLRALTALMDHEGVPHPQGVREESFLALLEDLERQARGLQADPDNAQAAQSALDFLAMMRHLDLAPPYFERLEALRARAADPHGEGAFSHNALAVALTDLHNSRLQLATLEPAQYPHALARMAAQPCPQGLTAYAAAEPERRLEPLAACALPCAQAPLSAPGPEVLRRCQNALACPPDLFSPDNELMLRSLAAIQHLADDLQAALDSPSPLLERARPQLTARLQELRKHLFTLSLPAHEGGFGAQGLALPQGRYLAHPGVAPVIWVASASGVRLMTHPLAALGEGEVAVGGPEALRRWGAPGALVSPDAAPLASYGQEGWPAARARLLEEMQALVVAFEGALQLKPGSLDGFALAPALALPQEAPAAWLLALADAMRQRGLPAVALILYDAPQRRAGALELSLKPAAGAPLLELQPQGARLVIDGQKPRALADDAAILEAVKTLTAQSFQGVVPELALRVSPEVRYARLLEVIAALRFSPQPEGEALRPLVEAFSLAP
jgi:hypothetical protein